MEEQQHDNAQAAMDQPQQIPASIEINDSLRTPEKVQKISRDESFKTCEAQLPTPKTRRQLRATPARNSILSGGKPYKEVLSSGRKFNSRRKGRLQRSVDGKSQLNDTADSNETFIRHERDLFFDRDSLDTDLSVQKQQQQRRQNQQPISEDPYDLSDNITELVIAPRTSSPKMVPLRDPSPKRSSPRKVSPKKLSPKKASPKRASQIQPSPSKKQSTRVISRPKPKPGIMPTSTPMPMAAPKSRPKPNPVQWNRYMSSTAKKPTMSGAGQFKKPASIMMDSSVASSRRCLAQWNTPRVVRTQSFKSTAELERDYFSSLRSSRS